MRLNLHSIAFWLLVSLLIGFVLLPAVVTAIVAFNAGAVITFPPKDWSLRWFERALTYRDFQRGLWNSVIVMLWTSVFAVSIGGAFAWVIDRCDFPGKRLLEGLLTSSLLIPSFTIGIGFLILANQVAMNRSFAVVIVTHVILVLPFVMRAVFVSLRSIDPSLERAAASLGAGPWAVLRTITLPLMVPGLFSGLLFAAILSFNEFTATLFVSAQATQTLPVAMYNYVREYADPSMAALSVMFFVMITVVLALTNWLMDLGRILAIKSQDH